MILVLAIGGFGLLVLALILFFLLRKKRAPKLAVAKDGSIPANASILKEEVPAVSSVVVGEKASDVMTSGYFAAVYPGTQVITKPQGTKTALPAGTPTFMLLTDSTGTITGVTANNAVWAPAK